MKVKSVLEYFVGLGEIETPITDRAINHGYRQIKEGYIDRAVREKIIKSKKELPSQWWHLISYCTNKIEKEGKDSLFNRQVQCGELILWMAEVSKSVSEDKLNSLVDTIEGNKHSRAELNIIIRDACFGNIQTEVIKIKS